MKRRFTFSACGRDFTTYEEAEAHGRREAAELGIASFKIFENVWIGSKLSAFITAATITLNPKAS